MKLLASMIVVAAALAAAAQTPSPTPLDLAGEKQRADRLQARLNDFANFSRYREANMKLSPPGKDENRVVFLGDSITDSWKLDQDFPGRPFVNRGISGQTTSQMLLRFRPDVIDLKPRVVVILAGTNDIAGNTGPISLDRIQGNIASMVDLALAHGIRVILASILPVSDHNRNAQGVQIIRTVQRRPAEILQLNTWMKKLSEKRGLTYLDYFSATADESGFLRADLANDGLHPNTRGYQIMKPLAERAVAASLKTKPKK